MIKVAHIIDTLEVGGAEKVAVNMVNSLKKEDIFSFLIATRNEGELKNILKNKNYFFLQKRIFLDIKAIIKLIRYIRDNKISILHTHSSSIFIGILVKFFLPVKLIWHDHYGNLENSERKHIQFYKFAMKFVDYVIVVNKNLLDWNIKNLLVNKSKIEYIPNFSVLSRTREEIQIPGEEGKRIICLANFRSQKDHITLLKAVKIVFDKYPDWSLLLLGKNFKDDYSKKVFNTIKEFNLSKNIFYLGVTPNVNTYLLNCNIGVLSSVSEGLPLSIIEYGLAGLAVVATNVGEIPKVLENGKFGMISEKSNFSMLSKAILELIDNRNMSDNFARLFNKHINENYSQKAVMQRIINVYRNI